ncbi:MAG: hypothetical protein M1815_003322 [Lichina confinis]|nr:MAG: hypothetical protein M1815_003322 [Lichina confinis]
MSFLPTLPVSEFGPLFRLLDDYDNHRTGSRRGGQSIQSFQPRFDVRETKDAYELHGELPGIDQKDIQIEFSDPHTIVIKGRVERDYQAGAPEQGRITGEAGEEKPHKATVEDEDQEAPKQVVNQNQRSDVGHSKYWVTERTVGEFHRSFGFPTRVDQDSVKATLRNGVLNIRVPKAAAQQAKRINIE